MHGDLLKRLECRGPASMVVRLAEQYTARVYVVRGEVVFAVFRWTPTRAGRVRHTGWFEVSPRGAIVPRARPGKLAKLPKEWLPMLSAAAAFLASRTGARKCSPPEALLGVRVEEMTDNPMR